MIRCALTPFFWKGIFLCLRELRYTKAFCITRLQESVAKAYINYSLNIASRNKNAIMRSKKHVAFERSYVYVVHMDTICVSDCNIQDIRYYSYRIHMPEPYFCSNHAFPVQIEIFKSRSKSRKKNKKMYPQKHLSWRRSPATGNTYHAKYRGICTDSEFSVWFFFLLPVFIYLKYLSHFCGSDAVRDVVRYRVWCCR